MGSYRAIVVGLLTAVAVFVLEVAALALKLKWLLMAVTIPAFPILLVVGNTLNVRKVEGPYLAFATAALFWGLIAAAAAWLFGPRRTPAK